MELLAGELVATVEMIGEKKSGRRVRVGVRPPRI